MINLSPDGLANKFVINLAILNSLFLDDRQVEDFRVGEGSHLFEATVMWSCKCCSFR